VAVAEAPGDRALYFDKSDNGLQGKVGSGTKVMEIELVRVAAEETSSRRAVYGIGHQRGVRVLSWARGEPSLSFWPRFLSDHTQVVYFCGSCLREQDLQTSIVELERGRCHGGGRGKV
jgi:hypothetical protein